MHDNHKSINQWSKSSTKIQLSPQKKKWNINAFELSMFIHWIHFKKHFISKSKTYPNTQIMDRKLITIFVVVHTNANISHWWKLNEEIRILKKKQLICTIEFDTHTFKNDSNNDPKNPEKNKKQSTTYKRLSSFI